MKKLTLKTGKGITILLVLIIFGHYLTAENPPRIYTTAKIVQTPPVIDGLVDEAAWDAVNWEGNFIQRQPYDSAAPSQNTEFKILYDDNNLYIAIMAYDTEPDKIERRLSRRDQLDGDLVSISIDSYSDKLTAFDFIVSAAGVKSDKMVTNDTDEDDSWDPVWYVKTSFSDKGWMAEMKIPYSQLRFAQKNNYVWGLQIARWVFRQEELSVWQYIPVESSRWVSMFGELHGIHDIYPKKEIELKPYVMGNIEKYEKEEGNPFAPGTDYNYSAGLDGKIAVTNDLTLNLTVNPDFGQVEADPSEVNLTAFETFFEEKRPFFVEGNNIYNYSLTDGDSPLSADNLFYSRRIGRQPHHEPDLQNGEYMDMPESTQILGAFKLSGKTRNGLSVGIMESLTNEEKAVIDSEGEQKKLVIEPMTNYFNTRLQKDIKKGNTILGGMVTATNRIMSDPAKDSLHHSAYTGGVDFTNYWKEKKYYFRLTSVFSHVIGNPTSITYLQESPRRYYQRPDAGHLTLDSSRTKLTGNGGTVEGGKIGGGHWRYLGWITWRSPGLELNDMGYLRQADHIMQVAWAQYRIWEPFSIFRRASFNFNQWSGWDFAGTMFYFGGNFNFNLQFKNYWSLGSGINRGLSNINRSELRGGPAIQYPGDWNHWVSISSDERKKLVTEFFMFNNWGDLNHSRFIETGLELSYRPWNFLSLSVEPGYTKGRRDLQYVETLEFENQDRYIISTLNSEIFSADFRINISITPDFTIQYWGQPFLFAGNYSAFKKVTEPMAENYNERFHIFNGDEISYDPEENFYNIDENLNGTVDYSFENPNFNFFEFRSNLVVRWEYIPGSAVYLVWSQGRNGDNPNGEFNFTADMKELYSIEPHNIFLVKLSFRLSI